MEEPCRNSLTNSLADTIFEVKVARCPDSPPPLPDALVLALLDVGGNDIPGLKTVMNLFTFSPSKRKTVFVHPGYLRFLAFSRFANLSSTTSLSPCWMPRSKARR